MTATHASPALDRSLPSNRFLLAWALAWAVVGCVVAVGIVALTEGRVDTMPALRFGILTAELVGFSSLASARVVFPLFARLTYLVVLPLQVVTLLLGTLLGGVLVLFVDPLFGLAEVGPVAAILGLNGLISVLVGTGLSTYDSMRRQIEGSYAALREKEAYERELRVARDVQQELLPREPPAVEGLELAGVCRPAIGVGGDYYDFLALGGARAGLLIADVSGKGVPAALLMAGLQAAVRSMPPGTPPGALVARLNDVLFASSSSSRYATLFYGEYDAGTRALRFANAGHHPPLVVGRDGAREVDGSTGGLPIGLFEGTTYDEGRVELRPGDLVALFTDGVVEAPDPAGTEFGAERLREALERARDRPLADVIDEVLDELTRWGAGRSAHDDVTLVLARAL